MKLGKAVALAVLPIVAGYAGAKGYVYYKARAAVDRLVEQAAVLGTLEYRDISSSLADGSVQVAGLILSTNGVPDTITIRSVSLRTGSFPALLDLARQSDSNKPPPSLAVRFDGVSLKSDGPLLQVADRLMQAAAAASGVPQTSAHCANQPLNGVAILSRLGYDTLTFNGEIGYKMDKGSGRVTLDTELEVHEMMRVSTRIELASGADVPDFSSASAFKTLDVTYQDLSYKERVKRFCTQAAKISDAEYLRAEVEGGMLTQQFGIIPGPGLRAAYRDFLETPNAEFRFRLEPSDGFDPRGISFYRPDEVLRQLNALVTVNSKPVEDLSFEFGRPVVARANAPTQPSVAAPTESKAVVAAAARESARPPVEPQYRPVDVAELERYLDYTVRLHEVGQQPREGRLTEIDGGIALVERRYGTGLVTVKVPLAKVARAEVLR